MRKPDLRISFRRAVAQVGPVAGGEAHAEALLLPLLTDRQRAAL